MKLIIAERGTGEAGAAWDEADFRLSSHLLYPEARAALARAARAGRVRRRQVIAARGVIEQLWREVDPIRVTESLVRQAGELAERHGLRAYDAVHLASLDAVADADTVLVAADGELLAAARALGVATAPV